MGTQDIDEKEVLRIGRIVTHHRGLGVRWCVLKKMFTMTKKELGRCKAMFKAKQQEQKNG